MSVQSGDHVGSPLHRTDLEAVYGGPAGDAGRGLAIAHPDRIGLLTTVADMVLDLVCFAITILVDFHLVVVSGVDQISDGDDVATVGIDAELGLERRDSHVGPNASVALEIRIDRPNRRAVAGIRDGHHTVLHHH